MSGFEKKKTSVNSEIILRHNVVFAIEQNEFRDMHSLIYPQSNVAPLALGLEIFILAQISSDMWLLEAFGER